MDHKRPNSFRRPPPPRQPPDKRTWSKPIPNTPNECTLVRVPNRLIVASNAPKSIEECLPLLQRNSDSNLKTHELERIVPTLDEPKLLESLHVELRKRSIAINLIERKKRIVRIKIEKLNHSLTFTCSTEDDNHQTTTNRKENSPNQLAVNVDSLGSRTG